MIASVVGTLGAVILVLLPGNWVTFGGRLDGFGFWPRLAVGVLLSPAVVFLQFYLLRWLHVPFEHIALILPLLNLPVVWVMWRREVPAALPGGYTLLAWVFTLALPAAYLWLWKGKLGTRLVAYRYRLHAGARGDAAGGAAACGYQSRLPVGD